MNGKFMWILDNGHGKATSGKRSPLFEDGSRFYEYEFNRDIVGRLIVKLSNTGLSFYNLVPEIEGDISLNERVRRANTLQTHLIKIYISIHSNAASNSGWSNASGIETYCYIKPSKSERLAQCFQKNLVKNLNWRDRGVKTANFYVIRYTQMPAILTESGFYDNKIECRKLMSNEYREKIADAHFQSILEIENIGVNF